jgi:nucleoside-diphosphate-sugar epimerase
VQYVIADIRDQNSIEKYFSGVQVVHHTAALVPLTKNYGEFKSVNEFGSEVVARVSRKCNVEVFIHTSSSAVFGKTSDQPIGIDTILKPIEPYGKSKLRGEISVKRVLSECETRLVVIRPRTILGTERGGIFDLFFSWIQSNEPIFTIGSGNNSFQFVHEEDLIDAMFLILKSEVSGDFNVGTDRFGTLNDVFKSLIDDAGSTSKIVHLPVIPTIFSLSALEKLKLSPLAPWHYKTFHLPFFFDVNPILELGWKPKYSNNELMLSAYNSYLEWSREKPEKNSSPHRSKLDAGILKLVQKLFK